MGSNPIDGSAVYRLGGDLASTSRGNLKEHVGPTVPGSTVLFGILGFLADDAVTGAGEVELAATPTRQESLAA